MHLSVGSANNYVFLLPVKNFTGKIFYNLTCSHFDKTRINFQKWIQTAIKTSINNLGRFTNSKETADLVNGCLNENPWLQVARLWIPLFTNHYS